jgi:predicted helicase
VVYIEAKDIGVDLNSKSLKEQFDRYKAALDNLIITDYLDFHFYIDGAFKTSIKIAETANGKIKPLPENFSRFETLIKDACLHIGQTIKSSKKLAEMMAAKAKMLADVIEKAIKSDEHTQENSSINDQMNAFKEILIHDITPKEFADIYAQTIAYGMFSARLHDPSLPTFTREEAAILIPKTNPFLRKLFQYIAGYDLDTRLVWIVDSLADIFRATDINALLKNFGKATQTHDPIIHFYETFLSEYDPKLRKARGVWYTPEPVVNFIVRAVDDILKTEFNLPQGLADTSKTKIKIATQNFDKKTGKYKEEEKEVHKVQILDPATGTGTFLAEVVKHIYKKFEGQQGIWSNYLENHLIPRLNGFELLMASYAMAHLKLDLLTTETGYKPTRDQRFRIYLTNSLEEHHPDTGTLFANWLSTEANEANQIKRDTPVMVVLGNPPYSLSSSNKGKWIENLTEEYKKDLNEQNLNALSDDYVKFLRYAQYFIEKNGVGTVAMITNNSFIDGITQRNMRKSLLHTFNEIYIYDLHGSAKRKEKALDGTKDENVFDIQQGVSINIFIKSSDKNDNEKNVWHYESYGKRNKKYEELENNTIKSIKWNKVIPSEPYWFFVPKNDSGVKQYNAGISVNELFNISGNGIKFRKDNLLVKYMFSKSDVLNMLEDVSNKDAKIVYDKYNFKSTPDWKLEEKKSLFKANDKESIVIIEYRQFDKRYTYYPLDKINQIIVRGDSRKGLMQNYIKGENIGLIIGRQGQVVGDMPWNLIFIANHPTDMNIFYRGGGINFPLYVYSVADGEELIEELNKRTPNLNLDIINEIATNLGLAFTNEKVEQTEGEVCFMNSPEVRPEFRATFAPIDILDYIYAVLHSPTYREKYKEFLKIDFPRVPYPKDPATFWKLVALGGELRQIHLLESPVVEKFITQYPVDGNNKVEKIKYEDKKVFINETQCFDKVPPVAWEFYIGGYQPAQKWLKDRKGRELSFDDILHYQKIIVALTETARTMQEIDGIEIE